MAVVPDHARAGALALELDREAEPGEADLDALKARCDAGRIVEIVAATALFGDLNRRNDAMATRLRPHALEVARRTIGPVGWQAGEHG